MLMGGGERTGASAVPVALTGRVPVRVNAEGGSIVPGDYLVPSSVPGIAMKATRPGMVVGQAMTFFDGEDAGTVVAFVKNGYFDGRDVFENIDDVRTSISGAVQEFVALAAQTGRMLVQLMIDKIVASVATIGELFTKTITILPGGNIIVPEGENQMSGSSVIGIGAGELFIPNTLVTSSSKIFVTPTSQTDIPIAVTRKEDGRGFGVGLARPATVLIPFDWLIIGSYRPEGVGDAVGEQVGLQSAPAVTVAEPMPEPQPMPLLEGNRSSDIENVNNEGNGSGDMGNERAETANNDTEESIEKEANTGSTMTRHSTEEMASDESMENVDPEITGTDTSDQDVEIATETVDAPQENIETSME